MTKQRLKYLLERYIDDTLSIGEREEWHTVLNDSELRSWLDELIDSSYYQLTEEELTGLPAPKKDEIFANIIKQGAPTENGKVRILWRRFAVAASVLLLLSASGYFLRHEQPRQLITQNQKQDIAPGGNKAILTLSNGQKIILDGKKGQIATQAGKQVLVGATGEITYTGQSNSHDPIYNTLTVPIGNRRDMVLPDGSQVSLDAGSSITYPVVFTAERRISMTGQAYIKVKHDAAHPFYTSVKGIIIKDIGTEFNINAYDDEPAIKTTLIAGSITVNDMTIKPGEQAQIKENKITVKTADTESATAWKDNDFLFRNQSLKTSMRQIARWYNVDVVYNNVDEKLKLYVNVTRSINLSVVLKAIENTGTVNCSLEGHTITLSQPINPTSH